MNLLTKIRKLEFSDLPEVLTLVNELAIYEKSPHEVTATLLDYETNFKQGVFEGLVAQNEQNELIGCAIYYYAWSTWKGKMLYLEDFVVKESVRGKGYGKLLFDHLIQVAKENKCVLMKWQVLDWNIPAINFYQKYDCVFDKDWWNGKIYF